ncbi:MULTISPECIES: alcohol dehydrogenase AdhP [Streptomyces]|uniref:alcohol dehydrogenase AdhP n=1 Tax=Streptomyces TaxID=1883 RepID=UPI000775CA17|nr:MULTISPECIES: alcohol dehydrogenase AdhP [Streptomyces]MYX83631.1 alcohol dehydrogenase AdhP [Streptomyces sp. SID4915]SCE17586.1 alcohol dehydrogenase, propanol-preferring [Streptomyces sp. IgraMP-1]AMM12394.1 Alcohol dehydrogenase [Streptomyces albidoflavus]RZE14862.1 alcohol dehydrogenase AdhP [Streptomyces albidoflavus]RZE32550.1 alcohol dehydrogenase AdhP [Streptomyces albidoflavus]
MKAAVVRSFTEPLVVEEREVPEPAGHQVLVRMETSGLCHTDIHAAHGDWPIKPSPPFVPGHEGIGVVEARGDQVDHVQVGQRVAIPWLGEACGHCEYCVSGWETLCLQQQNSGYSVDGSHTEYALAHGTYVVPVPDGIDPLDAAPLTCAGVTTYKAVKLSGARPGKRALVSGIGGLGHLALQYATIFGAETIAVDITDEKLQLARDLGADHVVDARTQDVAEEVRRLGGADAAISLAVSNDSFRAAYDSLNRGGTLVLVALPPEGELSIPVFDTVLNGTTVTGSIVGTREDLVEVFRLHQLGRTRVVRETRRLEDINTSIDEVLDGKVTARLVFDLR